MIPLLAGAIQLDIPVLIGVPDALFGSWLTPAGGLAVLAVMTDAEYRDDTVRLRPGDMIVTYTDGVTEAMNPKKELYFGTPPAGNADSDGGSLRRGHD